jgi:hypothetical protein
MPTNHGLAFNTYWIQAAQALKPTFFGFEPGPAFGTAGVAHSVRWGTYLQGTQNPDTGHPSYALLRFRLGDRNPVQGSTVSYDPGTSAMTSIGASGLHFFNHISINSRSMYTPVEPTQVRNLGVEILNPDHTPYQTHGVDNMIGVDLVSTAQRTGAAIV